MVATEQEFIHPQGTGCEKPSGSETVVFDGLDQAGVDSLLAADQGFWRSADLPRCETCGVGFQVIRQEVC